MNRFMFGAVCLAALGGAGIAHSASTPTATDRCTIAAPQVRATVEVRVPYASDFCEIASQLLTSNVFLAPVVVTPGVLWHYAGAPLSCRLRYGRTKQRMTVRRSTAACQWLLRIAPDWRIEPPTPRN